MVIIEVVTQKMDRAYGVVSQEGRIAGPESSSGRLIVSISVSIGAVALEVVVVEDTGRRARRSGVVVTSAAVGRVG